MVAGLEFIIVLLKVYTYFLLIKLIYKFRIYNCIIKRDRDKKMLKFIEAFRIYNCIIKSVYFLINKTNDFKFRIYNCIIKSI